MSDSRQFQPVESPFGHGLVDEQATQEAFVRFVGGKGRADALQMLWSRSYPQQSAYERHSKVEVFRAKAKREKFTDAEIDAFLSL